MKPCGGSFGVSGSEVRWLSARVLERSCVSVLVRDSWEDWGAKADAIVMMARRVMRERIIVLIVLLCVF